MLTSAARASRRLFLRVECLPKSLLSHELAATWVPLLACPAVLRLRLGSALLDEPAAAHAKRSAVMS